MARILVQTNDGSVTLVAGEDVTDRHFQEEIPAISLCQRLEDAIRRANSHQRRHRRERHHIEAVTSALTRTFD